MDGWDSYHLVIGLLRAPSMLIMAILTVSFIKVLVMVLIRILIIFMMRMWP